MSVLHPCHIGAALLGGAGYTNTCVSGFAVYTRGLPPLDGEWNSDGSKPLVVLKQLFAFSPIGNLLSVFCFLRVPCVSTNQDG